MSIRYKFLMAFGVVCLISAGVAIYSIHQLSSLSSLVVRLYDGPLMTISYARSAQANFAQARYAVEAAIVLREGVTAERTTAIENAMKQFSSDMSVVAERMDGVNDAEGSIKKIKSAAEEWYQMGMAYLKPPRTGLRDLPIPQVVIDKGREVGTEIESLVESAAAYGFSYRSGAETAVASMHTNLTAIAIGTVLAGLLLAFGSSYSLVRPLRALTAGMKELADGKFEIVLPGLGRKDEIGEIAAAVEAFKVKAESKAAEESQRKLDEMAEQERRAAAERDRADQDRQRGEEERVRLDEERRRADEERLRIAEERRQHAETQARAAVEQARAIEVLAEGLRLLSEGDLTVRLDDTLSDVYRQIRDDFNHAAEQLEGTIASIVAATREVTNASTEIASSTTDLSQRTEQQAANLERTSASMEEIATTVKKNAEDAQAANQSAGETRTVAERGGAVVSEAVQAMARIEEASHRIADIIGVIDEIARQTNLLALNAAVEAARAGDAGRGFAVVASEVRNLAQRSSQAAKDIKGLITDSNGLVKDGVGLVNKAGLSLSDILESIKRVSEIVANIASASREQAAGIEHVNNSLAQMDEATQQNSAVVEENAATAKMLEQQARAMDEQVAIFKIAANDAVAVPPPRRAAPKPAAAVAARAPAPSRGPQAATEAHRSVGRGPARRMQSALAVAMADDPDWKEF